MTKEREIPSLSKIISGTCLISGTCIGAGMLALPLVTYPAGFLGALFAIGAVWLYMMATGLLFMETTLWMPDGANLFSMARRFLGPVGQWLGGAAFLFLYYCLMVAYLAGGSPLFDTVLANVGIEEPGPLSAFFSFTLLFMAILAISTRAVDRVNWVLVGGLIFSYLIMIGYGVQETNATPPPNRPWLGLFALPVLFSAYGYHNVIPSVCTYLKRDARSIKIAIVTGTTITLLVYCVWQAIVSFNLTPEQIMQAKEEGTPLAILLAESTSPSLGRWVTWFSFFAISTSLLGVSLSLLDFLGDAFTIPVSSRTGLRRVGLALLAFTPPALIAMSNPTLFMRALSLAGGFGETVLNGFFPILMVWVGRYRRNLSSAYKLPGGRPLLALGILLTIVVVMTEVLHLKGRFF